MRNFFYYCSCVNWPKRDVHCPGGLCDMINANRTITRKTFLKYVDKESLSQLEFSLGYDRAGLLMCNDFAVSYHKSKLHDRIVYYFRQSSIEYVFAKENT